MNRDEADELLHAYDKLHKAYVKSIKQPDMHQHWAKWQAERESLLRVLCSESEAVARRRGLQAMVRHAEANGLYDIPEISSAELVE